MPEAPARRLPPLLHGRRRSPSMRCFESLKPYLSQFPPRDITDHLLRDKFFMKQILKSNETRELSRSVLNCPSVTAMDAYLINKKAIFPMPVSLGSGRNGVDDTLQTKNRSPTCSLFRNRGPFRQKGLSDRQAGTG